MAAPLRNTDSHPDADRFSYRYANCNGDTDCHARWDSHCNRNGNSEGNRDRDSHSHS